MKKSTLTIKPLPPFDFEQTMTAHGWAGLLPNFWDKKNKQMQRIQQLSDGSAVSLVISGNRSIENPQIIIDIRYLDSPGGQWKEEIKNIVSHMLRLDEDFSGFYELAKNETGRFMAMMHGYGRLLRSPTVFEDIVKTICTTNIQWGGTKRMIKEIVDGFGTSFHDEPDKKTFPAAQDIALYSFSDFISRTNLGYRADYIYQLVMRINKGDLDVESFTDPKLTTTDLRKKLLAVKGIGNYAAATMLMLLGHYDQLPVDSVFREFVFNRYFKGKPVALSHAEGIYEKWGNWKHLAYWFDMINE